jgi:hypothetical protein
MAFDRRDIFHIPTEFRDLTEAKRVRDAEADFRAALNREMKAVADSGERVHPISDELKRLERKLHEAQDTFDAATGLPIPAALTPKVKEQVVKLFPPHQREQGIELLEKQGGRTIPFHRDSDSMTLEPYRLRALSESKGGLGELKKQIEAANVFGREFL